MTMMREGRATVYGGPPTWGPIETLRAYKFDSARIFLVGRSLPGNLAAGIEPEHRLAVAWLQTTGKWTHDEAGLQSIGWVPLHLAQAPTKPPLPPLTAGKKWSLNHPDSFQAHPAKPAQTETHADEQFSESEIRRAFGLSPKMILPPNGEVVAIQYHDAFAGPDEIMLATCSNGAWFGMRSNTLLRHRQDGSARVLRWWPLTPETAVQCRTTAETYIRRDLAAAGKRWRDGIDRPWLGPAVNYGSCPPPLFPLFKQAACRWPRGTFDSTPCRRKEDAGKPWQAKRMAAQAAASAIVSKSVEEGRTLDEYETEQHKEFVAQVAAIDLHIALLHAHEALMDRSGDAAPAVNYGFSASIQPPIGMPAVVEGSVRMSRVPAPNEVESGLNVAPASGPFYRWPKGDFGVADGRWMVYRNRLTITVPAGDLVAEFSTKQEADEAVATLNAKGLSVGEARMMTHPTARLIRRGRQDRARLDAVAPSIRRFTIWTEGQWTKGRFPVPARLICTVDATTFREACDLTFASKASTQPLGSDVIYDADAGTLWGNRLFDNEADARRSFG